MLWCEIDLPIQQGEASVVSIREEVGGSPDVPAA
jgi:hypothetical protein